jgi:hypothetical protein
MSRGRPPSKGMDIALPVAKTRGRVVGLVQNGDTPGNFEIIVGGVVTFVGLCRADPFRCTPKEIETENRVRIARLRSVPASVHVLRELWIYSKYGSLRFFRVEDTWLLEIGPGGLPLGAGPAKETNGTSGNDPKKE